MNNTIEKLKGCLIVSCQALETEPLHSSFIMGRMAKAAYVGGASGIRANTVVDIKEIKKNVNLPIIGIIKKEYEDSEVYITPTEQEIKELIDEQVEIIAFDATKRKRPKGQSLENFIKTIRSKYPTQIFMADISSLEEAINAEKFGVNIIGTTLIGYTEYTKEDDPIEELKKIVKQVKIPVIAEGNIDTPEKARLAIEGGAFAIVVGGAITRPQLITKKFIEKIKD